MGLHLCLLLSSDKQFLLACKTSKELWPFSSCIARKSTAQPGCKQPGEAAEQPKPKENASQMILMCWLWGEDVVWVHWGGDMGESNVVSLFHCAWE